MVTEAVPAVEHGCPSPSFPHTQQVATLLQASLGPRSSMCPPTGLGPRLAGYMHTQYF